MNFGLYFVNSVKFTYQTFFGEWNRGSHFIALGVALGIISLLNPESVSSQSIQGQFYRLTWLKFFGLWFFINLFFIGYEIRILRGGDTPPDFKYIGCLVKDGIVSTIITCVWIIPLFLICLAFARFIPSFHNVIVAVFFMVLIILLIPMILVSQFIFARTGSFWYAFRVSRIRVVTDNLGLKRFSFTYLVGVVIFLIFMYFDEILFRVVPPVISGDIFLALHSIFISYLILVFGVLYDKFLTTVFENAGVPFSAET